MIVKGHDISLLPVGCPVRIVECDPNYPDGLDCLGLTGRIDYPNYSDPELAQYGSDIVSEMLYDHSAQVSTGYMRCHLTIRDAVEVLTGNTDG